MSLKRTITSVTLVSGLTVGTLAFAAPAFSHGYVNGPKSRAILCKEGVNVNCGAVAYEPQSLEYLKGFPEYGPADGKIASANGQFGGSLDAQSSTRWAKTDITPGPVLFDWTYTAPHATAKWHYYMTTPDWDPNAPLERSELELIATVDHDGSKASTNPDHVVNIPSNRSGYHVILAVWDVADTVNAFYNVIDVNVLGDQDPDVTAPTSPRSLSSSFPQTGGVTLAWNESRDDRGAVMYSVFRDNIKVGTSNTPTFTDLTAKPGRSYTYTVIATDPSGNTSAKSEALRVIVPEKPVVDVIAPTAPTKLHSMGVTQTQVKLMWGASQDASGAPTYDIYRNGYRIGSTSMTMFTDNSVAAGNTYQYVITAVDKAGNESTPSNTLAVTTPASPAPTDPAPVDPAPGAGGTWNDQAYYRKGDTVTANGKSYVAVQSHQGVGDPNWINALSLWAPTSTVPPIEPALETPTSTPTPAPAGAWISTGTYSAVDRVTFGGNIYVAVQSHTGNGDPNWIYAASLWQRI